MTSCGVCYDTTERTWPSEMYPADRVCEDCKTYEDYWLSLTPAQQREEHRIAEQHCAVGDEIGG